jgi:hypothetical protein
MRKYLGNVSSEDKHLPEPRTLTLIGRIKSWFYNDCFYRQSPGNPYFPAKALGELFVDLKVIPDPEFKPIDLKYFPVGNGAHQFSISSHGKASQTVRATHPGNELPRNRPLPEAM